jgi:hypothetical protein
VKTIGRGLVVAVCVLLLSNCGEYEQIERKEVLEKIGDSIYIRQKDSLRKELDSMCTERFDQYYQEAIDSIKAKQIKEIRDLIDN